MVNNFRQELQVEENLSRNIKSSVRKWSVLAVDDKLSLKLIMVKNVNIVPLLMRLVVCRCCVENDDAQFIHSCYFDNSLLCLYIYIYGCFIRHHFIVASLLIFIAPFQTVWCAIVAVNCHLTILCTRQMTKLLSPAIMLILVPFFINCMIHLVCCVSFHELSFCRWILSHSCDFICYYS